jgi:hypothetical protein
MTSMAPRARVIRFPKSPPPAAEPDPGLVEVRRCRDQAEALVVRGLLESENLAVILRSNLAPSVYPFSVGEQAEVILLVAASDAARARAVLGRRR